MAKCVPTIVSLEYWPILIPDYRLLNKSGLHGPHVPRLLMKITLSDDSSGWGECPCNQGMLIVLHQIKDLVRGRQATLEILTDILNTVVEKSRQIVEREQLADTRGTASFDQGITNHVRALIQMAAWDALAVSREQPLADLLAGGERLRSEVPFNAYFFYLADTAGSGLSYPKLKRKQWDNPFRKIRQRPAMSIDECVTMALAGVEHVVPDARLVKWKMGVMHPDVERDLIFALDDAFNQSRMIIPDPNGAWDVQTAVRITKELKAKLGDRLPYVEDLVMGRENMARVYRQTGVPQFTNMCAANFEEHEWAVSMAAIQGTLAGDPHYMGGSDEVVRLSYWCDEKNVGFGQHSNTHLEISLWHTVAAFGATKRLTHPLDSHYPLWQSGHGLGDEPVQFGTGGILRVPETSGIGFVPNMERVRTLHQAFCENNSGGRVLTNRDDGKFADVVYGNWTRPGSARLSQWFVAGVPTPVQF